MTSNASIPQGCGLSDGVFILPSVQPAALRDTPCIRFPHFLPSTVARELRHELLSGLVYERVEIGNITRQSRATRPLGDVYFGPMERREGWATPPTVEAALRLFESPAFLEWLSILAGEPITFRRPVTAYRMGQGDRLCLHDDMSDPDHAVSVAYNLSPDWRAEWGGLTVFGDVASVRPLPTPADAPFELREWIVRNAQRFMPLFNSLLVMRLAKRYAHGVEEVIGDRPRLALVGIYARASR